MIQAENLHKSFGEVQALKGVSFEAGDGRITGLLGPNGAGKTTTLRILYTVLKADQGEARVDGLEVDKHQLEVQRRIGVLPDSKGLYPRLTARENVRYYGKLKGLGGSRLEEEIERLIDILEMSEFADRPAEGFSTGERVKVGIARALIHEPPNVILDEPTSGLDVPGTRAMRDFIRRLRDRGTCVLFSSHIMQEVSALCDQIVVIAHGEVVAAGTPEDLRRSTGQSNLEDAFIAAIGSEEGLA